jgi:hypothetical protein
VLWLEEKMQPAALSRNYQAQHLRKACALVGFHSSRVVSAAAACHELEGSGTALWVDASQGGGGGLRLGQGLCITTVA